MKKMFLTSLFALSLLPVVSNAAQVTITSDSSSGGGFIGAQVVEADNTVSNSHSGLTADFDDFWTISLLPAAETFSIVNTTPKFDSLNVEYSLDSGRSWTPYDLVTSTSFGEIYTANVVDLSSFQLHISGDASNSLALSGSYQMTVNSSIQAVPVPAAIWLFGSALMGLVSVSKSTSRTVKV